MGSSSIKLRKPSRTASTEAQYLKRVATLKRKTRSGDAVNATPQDLSRWLVSQKGNYRAATYRQYRAALLVWLRSSCLDGCDEAIEMLRHDDQSTESSLKHSSRTSASKDKKFSDTDRFEVIEWLKLHPSKFSHALTVMLHIGGTVGLRPCEWQSASITRLPNSVFEIHIQNAKSTNGRSNGTSRTLSITSGDDGLAEVLEQFISLVSQLEWGDLYSGCRKLLHKATRAIWPYRKKYPTLYSLRHQFAADAKSAGMTKVQVAALMGHASIDTATAHYGKKRVGRGSCNAAPSQTDVNRLTNTHNQDSSNSLEQSL